MRHNLFTLSVLAAGVAALLAAPASAGVEVIPTAGRAIYRLALARVNADSLIVGATWDNRLCAFELGGRHRWDAALGGFAFDVACADLDGDGRDEILTAGADGVLACFSAEGKPRWQHTSPAPLQQVTVARLDGRSPVVLAGGMTREILVLSAQGELILSRKTDGDLGGVAIRMLRAGDFDGDGRDEVAVVGLRGRALDVRFLKGANLAPLPESFALNGLKTANATVADLDGDGTAELLIGQAIISLKGRAMKSAASPQRPGDAIASGAAANRPKGQVKGAAPKGAVATAARAQKKGQADQSPGGLTPLPEEPRAASYDYFYRMRSLAAGDFTNEPGREIALLDGPDLQLVAAAGRVLGAAHAPITFTDIIRLPGTTRDTLLLGSGLAGDDNLYRITFDRGWEKTLAELPASGQRKAIATNLSQIARNAAVWQGSPMTGADGPIDVVVNHHIWGPRTAMKSLEAWIDEVRVFERAFPYPRLRFSTCIWPGEQLPLRRPDGEVWAHDARLGHQLTRDDLLAIARRFEEAHCPFWIQVGHGCAPHLSAASALAMLAAAPKMCLGFVSAEDEQAEQMEYYFEHHIQPLLEACLARGKRFIPRNKNVWWVHWPANPALRRLVFNGRYRSVVLPCVEDSNSRTADAQLAARVGLWLDGQVDDWACRISADWFSFNRAWEWEAVKTGHPHLRYLTSQALLGARVFMLLAGDRGRLRDEWTRVGAEGVAPFLHLLGRGAITAPRREQLQAISPVVINLPRVSERFARHGANGHGFQLWDADGSERRAWAFDRLDCYWGMAPLPATDASTYLWGRTRRAADHLPITAPYGLVCLLPGPAPQARSPWRTVWTTDGDELSRAGQRFTLDAARAALTADLTAAAAQLPFRVEGRVFWQVVAQPENRYIICLLDPGWVDPAPRSAVLRANLAGEWRAADRLTHEAIGPIGSGLNLAIPAGAFRLLEVSAPP